MKEIDALVILKRGYYCYHPAYTDHTTVSSTKGDTDSNHL